MKYIGDIEAESIVYLTFTTTDALGAAVAPSSSFESTDIKVFKNGSTLKTTTNSIAVTSPLGGVTGLHLVEIDTSDNTGDAGFYAVASDYTVVLDPDDETVDGQAVVAVIGSFSIKGRSLADVDAALATVDGKVDTIKLKTDQLTFTSGEIHSFLKRTDNEVIGGYSFEPGALAGLGDWNIGKTGYSLATAPMPATEDGSSFTAIPDFAQLQSDVSQIKTQTTSIRIETLGPPIENGKLTLVKNKDYLDENSNLLEIPLDAVPGLDSADEALLTISHRDSNSHQLHRLSSDSIDLLNEKAFFAIGGAQLGYEEGALYRYMVELKHGTKYKAVVKGDHVLIRDIAE